VNDFGNPGSLTWYLGLVTSEHNQKPNFMATLAFLLAPVCGLYATIQSLPTLFDLDLAVGAQLDVVGLWIGRSRVVNVPLPNIYVTFDVTGLGFDGPGILFGGNDSAFSTVSLPDAQYRTYLRATAANNQWDGTLGGIYAVAPYWTGPINATLLVYDYQDMTVAYALAGSSIDAITALLFTNGLLTPRSEGVSVRGYTVQTSSSPLFAVDGPLLGPGSVHLTAGVDQGAISG